MTQVSPTNKQIWSDGLWHNNPGLVQLLGLCPLLAVSSSVVNGLGLGLATILVLAISSTTVSAVRRWLAPEIRIPAFVLIIAATVTAVEMVFQAWFFELSRTLGIFIPLIVTNCTIIARAEAFASRQRIASALSDALANGAGFAAVLVALGGMRELIGRGTLFADFHLLLGEAWTGISLQLLPGNWQFLPVLLPPGAFILLGLLVALRQYIQARPHAAAVWPASMRLASNPPGPPARGGRSRSLNPVKAANREEFFRRLAQLNPEPTTELEYRTPFELLIAVILSAQATDVGVNKATRRLFPVAATPEAVLALGEDGLKQYIQTIGLFNGKAKNIIRTCEILLQEHGGEVPDDRAALEALPGVGRKTANVILNTAFGHETIAVDTHIFRVGNRTGLAPGKTPLEVEKKLLKRVPAEFRRHAHHWLILHGRYTCKARRPKCPECPVIDLCCYSRKEMQ